MEEPSRFVLPSFSSRNSLENGQSDRIKRIQSFKILQPRNRVILKQTKTPKDRKLTNNA